MLERLLDALASLPLVPTYLVLMALSALENVFPPVPADTAVALGAFLARREQQDLVAQHRDAQLGVARRPVVAVGVVERVDVPVLGPVFLAQELQAQLVRR